MDRSILDLPFYGVEHRQLSDAIFDWASTAMPAIDHHDTDNACRQLVAALGKAGFLRYAVPAAYGGALDELDSRSLCIARETLAYHDGLADFAFAMQGLGTAQSRCRAAKRSSAMCCPRWRKEMQLELKALQQQLGITFVYVTHDQEEALTMSDRIAVMSKGKVQQIGAPVEVYERPANQFVADFIGESNFFEGKINSLSKDEAVVFVPELNAELTGLPVSPGLVNGEDVTVSIRPEKVLIAEKGMNQNTFTGKVMNTVYIATDTHVYVDLQGKRVKVFEQNRISRLDPGSFYTIGQDVLLVMMPENVEIQNPLNFVNNFSEVSKELLDEMKAVIENGNIFEAKHIINDLIQNLEKINHHGKRADGIVKGMLQHSRSNTGQKEPTDLNALCDEYVRLAYHGLRAKEKAFNAKFETSLDETIGKINVLPRDIGRVMLNLLNNAFYAVNERSKEGDAEYKPIVSVTTKLMANSQVQIVVKDNGNGIPENIKDKIFQPFFTTKPTGQGTGLGLSLSYDIVKAHGGEIKLETSEGEGTTFIITLPK